MSVHIGVPPWAECCVDGCEDRVPPEHKYCSLHQQTVKNTPRFGVNDRR